MTEFWNSAFTEKSFEVLKKLKGEFDFVLIGGWAVYLYTKSQKSKDVDIVINYPTLDFLRKKYALNKNADLLKYEFKVDEISVDIYVSYFSKLIIPCSEIEKRTRDVEGFKVPEPEVLLALKQQAEFVRKGIKAQKDKVDLILLLLYSGVDIRKYKLLAKEFNLQGYIERLRLIINESKEEWNYLGYSNLKEVKQLKQALLRKLAGV